MGTGSSNSPISIGYIARSWHMASIWIKIDYADGKKNVLAGGFKDTIEPRVVGK
jgi:hypothetical protein